MRLESLIYSFISLSFYLGNVYIADFGNYRIRKVTVSTGIITTIAGTGTISYSGAGDNGPATGASFNGPRGIAFDSAGSSYSLACIFSLFF